ncbi:MAG TPA: cytochrome C [Desulfobacteraceae bacterium]|jgi:c(7)-type cytochrome triheme protein|nr:cytochrome C [Desulfobacteraceae bacterium]
MNVKIAVAAVVAVVMIAAFSIAADKPAEPGKGPEKLTITVEKKGDVKLPHKLHQDVLKDCAVCHDVFPKKAGSINEMKAAGKLEKKQVMNKQCIKCHNDKKNAGVKSGPTGCTACHG